MTDRIAASFLAGLADNEGGGRRGPMSARGSKDDPPGGTVEIVASGTAWAESRGLFSPGGGRAVPKLTGITRMKVGRLIAASFWRVVRSP